MAITSDLLIKLLTKYAGLPNQEAVLVADEVDDIREAEVTLTAAQIKALAATPIELVPAAAGKINVLHHLVLEVIAGSEVLAESGDNMQVKYMDDSGLAATAEIETTGLIDQLTNQHAIVHGADVPVGAVAEVVNTPLVLDNIGSEFTGNASNDAQFKVTARYSRVAV